MLIGEVGLGGQIRPVSQMELRLKEAAKLGLGAFQAGAGTKRAMLFLLKSSLAWGHGHGGDIEVGRVVDAIATALANSTQHEPEEYMGLEPLLSHSLWRQF